MSNNIPKDGDICPPNCNLIVTVETFLTAEYLVAESIRIAAESIRKD